MRYKDSHGKTYITVSKHDISTNKPVKKVTAMRIANNYFKAKLEDLRLQSGDVIGNQLRVYNDHSHSEWVVSRR